MHTFIASIMLHPQVWLTAHILGVCIGLGGATIADVLFFRFLKDFRISEKEADVMRSLSHIILGALIVILLSGAALYLSDTEKYNASPAFLAKMTIVVVLTVNGFFLHEYISPKLVHLSFTKHYRSEPRLRVLRHIAFALGAVSASSWYSAFFIAMLKSLMLHATFFHILATYLFIVTCAVATSQIIAFRLHHRRTQQK